MFKKEKNKDLHYSVQGFLAAADISAAADKILEKYGEKAKIPGFRTGHIPLTELRKRWGEAAFGEAADNLMNEDIRKFAEEKKLRLAGAPRADVQKFANGADVEYSLEFDILPELPKIDLEKFTITKKVAEVPAAEIEKALENLRKSRAQAEKQLDGYRATDGDLVVIDFKGFVGDEAFEGGQATGYRLILGSGSFIPGFEEKIVGHGVDEEFNIYVKFPKDYHNEKLADADARFAIKLLEIRHHILPELNDALAKEVGHESVAALREHIKKILAEQYEETARREMRDELLDLLADKVKLNLPETLVEQEVAMAKSEFDKHAGHVHATDKKFDEKKERRDAERRVKLGLILAEWGTKNGIKVDNTDLQKAIWAEASRYPNQQQVFDFYNKNPNAVSMMRGMLFEQKSSDAMLAQIKIKEKIARPEELFKQAEPK